MQVRCSNDLSSFQAILDHVSLVEMVVAFILRVSD